MEGTKVALHLVAGMAQGGCNGAASMSQQGASQQDHQFPPGWGCKQWPKDGQNLSNGIGQGHAFSPEQDIAFVSFYLTPEGFHALCFSPNCTKSSLAERPSQWLRNDNWLSLLEMQT